MLLFLGELNMNCENNFCIYQSNGECILKEINIDGLGMCTECIYPNIDINILNKAKTDFLKRYEKK